MLQRVNRWRAFISPRREAVAIVGREQAKAKELRAKVKQLTDELGQEQAENYELRRRVGQLESVVEDLNETLDRLRKQLDRSESENEVLKLTSEDLIARYEKSLELSKMEAAISVARRQAVLNNHAPPRVD